MSPIQAVSVAVRIFAVWLALYVLRTVSSIAFLRHSQQPGLWVPVALTVVTALLAAALWFFPRTIAGTLLSPDNARPQGPASPDLWLAMGCSLLGLWMLTSSLPSLVLGAYALFYVDSGISDSDLKSTVLYNLVEVAAALWLIFGARGFRRLFWWAQNAGIKKTL
jgi:hypothetical protein